MKTHTVEMDTIEGNSATVHCTFDLCDEEGDVMFSTFTSTRPLCVEDIQNLAEWIMEDRKEWEENVDDRHPSNERTELLGPSGYSWASRERDVWNKCDHCGRFISYADFESGKAIRQMITPMSDVSYETFETLCPNHYNKEIAQQP